MKKLLLVFAAVTVAATTTFAQKKSNGKFGWKIGLLTSLPTDLDVPQTRITLGSTVGEVNRKLSKKITATGSMAYVRYTDTEGRDFAQIPVLLGARYAIDNQFYFGANAGVAFFNKSEFGSTSFLYSPYIGMQIKKISIDARYMNTVREEPIKVICLVFSYTL